MNKAVANPMDVQVSEIFDRWSDLNKGAGLKIRDLIFESARALPEVGAIFETLKWNQPAYLTQDTGSGTTIRLDVTKSGDRIGLYFHCQTTLIETFRARYSDRLVFDKNRAILLDPTKALPTEVLVHCIGMAQTYHLKK